MRISVTDVEAYRYFTRSEDMTLDVLRARLKHEAPPTDSMLLGRAFHALIETQAGTFDEIEHNGVPMKFGLEETVTIPPTVEVKGVMRVAGHDLVGKVDVLDGFIVRDHKVTGGVKDLGDYADSFQWRAYLEIFECDVFEYWFWRVGRLKHHWKFYELSKLKLYRYPGLEEDVRVAVQEYAEFYKRYVA